MDIVVNTITRNISIPTEKLQEIQNMCTQWTFKFTCTKRQLQSLLGSLYITKCIRPARFFLNRMLQVLRDSHNVSYIKLSQQFHCDFNWLHVFLKQYNGVTFQCTWMPHCRDLGGVFGPLVYALPLGTEFQHLHITQLEMLNVVVALKVWSQLWANKKVKIFCDNQAVVEVLNTGKTKDPFLATCARNVWLITAIFNIKIII